MFWGRGALAKTDAKRSNKLQHKSQEISALAEQNRHLLHRIHCLNNINAFSQNAAKPGPVRNVLLDAVSTALEISHSAKGSIQLCNPDKTELTVVVAEGKGSDKLIGQTTPICGNPSVAGYVATTGETVVVIKNTDWSDLPRQGSDRYTSRSFLTVPMVVDGETVGVLSVTEPTGNDSYDPVDAKYLFDLAEIVGSAVTTHREQQEVKAFNAELRRQLEHALAELDGVEDRLSGLKTYSETIIQNTSLGLLIFNDNLDILFANQRATAMLNINTGGAKTSCLSSSIRIATPENWAETLTSAVRHGRSVELYPVVVEGNENESPQLLRLLASPVRNDAGEPVASILAIEDATTQAMQQREQVISERHVATGKLVSRVAHELNNPLDGILRFVNLSIQCCPEDTRVRDYLKESKKGLERMVALIADLLVFSRKKPNPKQDSEDCNELIREAVKSMSLRAADTNVQVRLDLSPQLPAFRCGSLYQVFTNLLKNALDALPHGGQIEIQSQLDGNELVISFTDNGIGIPANLIDRIFDPFFTTKESHKGTGLGLAICHDIVATLNGRINVESTENVGSTFSVHVSPANVHTHLSQDFGTPPGGVL